jgi:phosphoribosyl-ATP pyrophosphohydrolase / phosphoribosyl-AMP cyclohydrolase / histidinol dehydrogenase
LREMAETFLLHVDLDRADSKQLEGLDLNTIRCFDHVVIKINTSSVEKALKFIEREFLDLTITADTRELQDATTVLSLLNAGAVRAIVNEDVLESILQTKALPDLSRLCVPLSTQTGVHFQNVFSSTASKENFPSILVDSRANETTIATAAQLLQTNSKTIFMNLSSWDRTLYTQMVSRGITPIVNASGFTTDPLKFPERKPVDLLLHSILTTDRSDQLYPTVIVDERDRCLGLVYSSGESIAEALASRRGVYKSRKREGLWIKGDTSGDIQDLLKIGLDCDHDTLLFKVRQRGDGKRRPSCF